MPSALIAALAAPIREVRRRSARDGRTRSPIRPRCCGGARDLLADVSAATRNGPGAGPLTVVGRGSRRRGRLRGDARRGHRPAGGPNRPAARAARDAGRQWHGPVSDCGTSSTASRTARPHSNRASTNRGARRVTGRSAASAGRGRRRRRRACGRAGRACRHAGRPGWFVSARADVPRADSTRRIRGPATRQCPRRPRGVGFRWRRRPIDEPADGFGRRRGFGARRCSAILPGWRGRTSRCRPLRRRCRRAGCPTAARQWHRMRWRPAPFDTR